ncbi:LamG-like jellyroll fold domain-containing protein [Amycolatopsis sp. NPDC006131]|uniref:LamG-like jellyroll fold domain-containing protein n=1 Tax=Amycolatopsis sp. NPDC006131 TaxID=3156731 RepID=UPI0033BF935A
MALEAAYAFDGSGSTVTDHSGNGRDINLDGTNGVQVAGALGKNGSVMPVLPDEVLAACETDDRTIMFDAQGNLGTWWVRFEKDSIDSGTWGLLNLGGNMAAQARRASDHGLADRPTAAPPVEDEWHNYCATYVRATGVLSIYRDGVLTNTTTWQVGAPGTQLAVGADRINLAEWTTTGPALDNLRLYSHALTSVEIAALAGTPVTSTGSSTAIGMAVETDTGFPIERAKARALGRATETDTANAVSVVKARIRRAVELDTAFPLARSKRVTIGRAVETSEAHPVTVTSGHTIVHLNVNLELGPTRVLERVTAGGTRLAWTIGPTRGERGE